MNECYDACPSGSHDECPNGKTCHTWLTCKPATVDPAMYNVCGKNYLHASETCGRRCYLGNDDACPSGQTCFGGVTDCTEDRLPPLTAEDVKLSGDNVEGGTADSSSSEPGSKWCGSTYEEMEQTCSKQCVSDVDCGGGKKCWDAPGTCLTVGVPAKVVASRWCGTTYEDAMTSCHAPCPDGTDADCPEGMSCFVGSSCTTEGVPIVQEQSVSGKHCGETWESTSDDCSQPCEEDVDCTEENYW